MKISSKNLFDTGNALFSRSTGKKQINPEESLNPWNNLESKVTLSSAMLSSSAVSEESLPSAVPEKKKTEETFFTLETGMFKGSTIKVRGNRLAGLSYPTTLTIIEEPVQTFLTPESRGKLTTPLLAVPDTYQTTNYSCGASSLEAVLRYWGIKLSETELMKLLNTTTEGTHPRDMVRVARELGLGAELKENLTLEDLEKSVQEGVPVIVDGQAWRDGEDVNKPWSELWEHGHYMVVIGLDEKNVYFEDPSIEGSRGFMSRQEFEERWHDYEKEGQQSRYQKGIKQYIHSGIFIRGEKPAPQPAQSLPSLSIHID